MYKNIIAYSTEKFLKNAANRHKAFYFNYYTAENNNFEEATNKWADKKELLITISSEINDGNLTWQNQSLLVFVLAFCFRYSSHRLNRDTLYNPIGFHLNHNF